MPTNKRGFKIGIWFPMRPFAPLTGEGILRLLCQIVKAGTAQDGTFFVIATTIWTRDDLERELLDHDIPMKDIEIVSNRRRTPFFYRVQKWLMSPAPAKRPMIAWLRNLLHAAMKSPALQRVCLWVLATNSYLVAIALVFPVMLLLAATSLLYAPFSLLGRLLSKRPGIGRAISVASPRRIFARILENPTRVGYRVVYNKLVIREFERLADKVSRRDDVRMWFVPHPSSVEATRIRKPLVVAVPDVVYIEFPTLYHAPDMIGIDKQISDVLGSATSVISYSKYVQVHHVQRILGTKAGSTVVIKHAPIDVSDHLDDMSNRYAGDSRLASLALIRRYVACEYNPPSWTSNVPLNYLRNFPFDEVPFLFVSSQIRMHKNYVNLFRAFELILRNRYQNVKMFISGQLNCRSGIQPADRLKEFLTRRHLYLDVISVPNLPPDVHAAFYRLAALTVVPTLFEGGFPFPFTESLSVGTPVVMSSIPVTREVLPKKLADVTLFDPYDVDDMADRIQWALDNREKLLKKQLTFYKKLCSRTWDDVADDYLKVLKEAATNGRQAS